MDRFKLRQIKLKEAGGHSGLFILFNQIREEGKGELTVPESVALKRKFPLDSSRDVPIDPDESKSQKKV